MCKCTPEIRTPWCGAVGCEFPEPSRPPEQQDAYKTGLVITRKIGEIVMIDTPLGAVEVRLVQVRGKAVRLLFSAPKEILIIRKEAYNPALVRKVFDK